MRAGERLRRERREERGKSGRMKGGGQTYKIYIYTYNVARYRVCASFSSALQPFHTAVVNGRQYLIVCVNKRLVYSTSLWSPSLSVIGLPSVSPSMMGGGWERASSLAWGRLAWGRLAMGRGRVGTT